MRRCAVLFALAIAGCGDSTKPRVEPSQKETADTKPPAVVQKPKHDYQGWKEYASAEAGFKVRFPGEPIVKTASPATGNFHLVGIQRQAIDELGYTCQWTIKEKAYENKEAEAAYLKGQQSGAVKSSKGKLVEENAIVSDGFTGRQYIIEVASQNVLHCRSYLAGKRVITLQVWGKDVESVQSPNAVKFFDSLMIGQ
jgi:hypothetical protein